MENEIKVGEYGRTNLGKIIKFAWLSDADGKRYENKVILVDKMMTETYPFYYFKKDEHIVKHSPNLIDLIQCGDYVNGQEVETVYGYDEDGNDKDGMGICEVEDDYAYYKYLEDINITTIVTKEMMESISYQVK